MRDKFLLNRQGKGPLETLKKDAVLNFFPEIRMGCIELRAVKFTRELRHTAAMPPSIICQVLRNIL